MSLRTERPLVIAGASYAGVALAAAARDQGFDGRVVMVGDEVLAPYQRPPLSKGLLLGKTAVDQLSLRGDAFYADNGIELRLGVRAVALDVCARTLTMSDGSIASYEWLALTTGARCRTLDMPGAGQCEVLTLRTLGDAQAILRRAQRAQHVCIVGGGFIGLEIASAWVALGRQVTVIEAAPRILARALPARVSDFIAATHVARGVKLVVGHGVRMLHAQGGVVQAVELDDGTRIDCDCVIAGIGVIPNDELAVQAGLSTRNGIVVDRCGRTSAANVLAAGDCASFSHPFHADPDAAVRPESIQAANDMARTAAATLVGKPQPYSAVPWFWSEQYDLRVQMAGLTQPCDRYVLRGSTADSRFTLFGMNAGRVTEAHSVNRPAEHMAARKLVASMGEVDVEQLADLSIDLKTLGPPVAR